MESSSENDAPTSSEQPPDHEADGNSSSSDDDRVRAHSLLSAKRLGKSIARGCNCTPAQNENGNKQNVCSYCCDHNVGMARDMTGSDESDVDPPMSGISSPSNGLLSYTNSTAETSSANSQVSTIVSSVPATPDSGEGSSTMTTPKFAGQTEPAIALDYEVTKATGQELFYRKTKTSLSKRFKHDDDKRS